MQSFYRGRDRPNQADPVHVPFTPLFHRVSSGGAGLEPALNFKPVLPIFNALSQENRFRSAIEPLERRTACVGGWRLGYGDQQEKLKLCCRNTNQSVASLYLFNSSVIYKMYLTLIEERLKLALTSYIRLSRGVSGEKVASSLGNLRLCTRNHCSFCKGAGCVTFYVNIPGGCVLHV